MTIFVDICICHSDISGIRLEKVWRDCKKHKKDCRKAHSEFKVSQKDFDQEARRFKQKWHREQVLEVERLNYEDPVGF